MRMFSFYKKWNRQSSCLAFFFLKWWINWNSRQRSGWEQGYIRRLATRSLQMENCTREFVSLHKAAIIMEVTVSPLWRLSPSFNNLAWNSSQSIFTLVVNIVHSAYKLNLELYVFIPTGTPGTGPIAYSILILPNRRLDAQWTGGRGATRKTSETGAITARNTRTDTLNMGWMSDINCDCFIPCAPWRSARKEPPKLDDCERGIKHRLSFQRGGGNGDRRWNRTKLERYWSFSPSHAWSAIWQSAPGRRRAWALRVFLTTCRSGWIICGNWVKYTSCDEGFTDLH